MTLTPRTLIVPAVLLTPLLLIACGDDGGTTGDDAASGRVAVTASFYPLAYLAAEIGGDRVAVTNLTAPGAEPHDLELTPDAVVGIVEADLVVYLSSFQPAVDDAIAQGDPNRALDVAESADLTLLASETEQHEHEHDDEHDDEHGTDGEHTETAADPHFWLDPVRFGDVATAVADRLGEVDPDGRTVFSANLDRLRADLAELDGEFRDGLSTCTSTDLVTSHAAFGYLADRYGLTQRGIAGITPDAEPDPEAVASASEFVEANDVSTIFFETLVSPAVAETVAAETGAATAVLDPIEGLTEDSAGDDYLSVMRSNLSSLRTGLSCG